MVDVLLGIGSIGCLLMVGAPLFIATRLRCVPIFNIKTAGEAIIHVIEFLHNVGVRGLVALSCILARARYTWGNAPTWIVLWGTASLASCSSMASTWPPPTVALTALLEVGNVELGNGHKCWCHCTWVLDCPPPNSLVRGRLFALVMLAYAIICIIAD
jgi:hypothetical protein